MRDFGLDEMALELEERVLELEERVLGLEERVLGLDEQLESVCVGPALLSERPLVQEVGREERPLESGTDGPARDSGR